MNLEFEIHGQILKRINSQDDTIVSENYNVYTCRFYFDEGSRWIQINKFAIFHDSWGNSTTVHLGKNSSRLSCIVPDRVLKGSYFKVSIYGGNLLSTNPVSVPLMKSGYNHTHYPSHNYNGNCYDKGHHHYHNKDVFVEIFERLDDTCNSIVYDENCLHFFGNNGLIESVYLPFLTCGEIETLANTIAEEHINNIPLADSETDGLMSKEDKQKLDTIEEGANHIVVDTELDSESDNPISNKAVTLALDGKEDIYDIVERIDDLIIDLINNGE